MNYEITKKVRHEVLYILFANFVFRVFVKKDALHTLYTLIGFLEQHEVITKSFRYNDS